MDDLTRSAANAQKTRPRLDFQEHLADLETRGLLTRIDHPVNKDTELHPLVRLQFIGGIPEAERRAFLFTNVVDGAGKRYDMPVVVGALAASAEIYALGMGCGVADIGSTRSPIRSRRCAPRRRAARRW
jgi:UbiD family decarboxylase